MVSPSSVRFDPDVLEKLRAYAVAHPGMSTSGAANRLVDEALRTQAHPQVTFRDGPSGRRARLSGGPDVWEILRAVRSAQGSDPDLSGDEAVAVVAETAGVTPGIVRAAIAYWSEYPDEIDALVERADTEEAQARARWERERELLGR